ncbi:DprA-like winged helix domain-containing protein [Kribbella sp. WER1]
MAIDAMLEHVVLAQLRHAPLTRAELVRRTSATDYTVQAALDELVQEGAVARLPQRGMPAEYELTAAGAIRLKLVAEMLDSPSKALGRALGGMLAGAISESVRDSSQVRMTPEELERAVLQTLGHGRKSRDELVRRTGAAPHEVQSILDHLLRRAVIVQRPQDIGPVEYELVGARPKRRPPKNLRNRGIPLTSEDRQRCAVALTDLYMAGTIDQAELSRRIDLFVSTARTRSDLKAVFDGLPMPDLDGPGPSASPAPEVSLVARPPAAERELVVRFVKELAVGVVFAGVLIVVHAPLLMAGFIGLVVGWRMFLVYQKWVKDHR